MVVTAGLDWDAQWWSSLWWTVKVCAGSVAGLVVIGWALARLTRWGRQFAALNLSYFIPGRTWVSWRAALSVLAMVWLAVADVRLTVLVSYATNGMFTAMQNFSGSDFARFLAIFALLAALNVIVKIALYYTERMFVLHWRTWLNGRMVNDWLTGVAYHKGRFVADPVDNPDQRIQEDITNFCEDSQTLGLGAVRAAVSLASFTVVLWSLSGPMTLAGTQVPRAMTFFAYLYVIAASVLAFRVGRPLIRLNFRNEGLSAAFRYALVRVRENSEAIAFYQGEHVEAATLGARFSAVITNYWALVRRGVKLEAVNLSVSQLAVIFPYLLQAPRFFAHAITLGGVHQTATAFGEVHDSLSFFRDSYDDFAKYRATLQRLTGLAEANARSRDCLRSRSASGPTACGRAG
jgi:putative ATP-binding cassette transporter